MQMKKISNSKSWLKLLVFLPIVGTVMVVNAETTTDYVCQQPQKKMVKKGSKTGKVMVGDKTIEVKNDTVAPASINIQFVDNEKSQKEEPLIIIDGERASMNELRALDPKTIDHVNVLKDKASVEVFGEEGKNGVIEIATKKAVSSGQR